MAQSKVVNGYLVNKIKNAGPLELVIIAYDGAINFLAQAKDSRLNGQERTARQLIIKGQRVIQELRSALNMDVGEISSNLFAMYRYMDRLLLKAHKEKDCGELDAVIRMLTELRSSWQAISQKPSLEPSRPAADFSELTA